MPAFQNLQDHLRTLEIIQLRQQEDGRLSKDDMRTVNHMVDVVGQEVDKLEKDKHVKADAQAEAMLAQRAVLILTLVQRLGSLRSRNLLQWRRFDEENEENREAEEKTKEQFKDDEFKHTTTLKPQVIPDASTPDMMAHNAKMLEPIKEAFKSRGKALTKEKIEVVVRVVTHFVTKHGTQSNIAKLKLLIEKIKSPDPAEVASAVSAINDLVGAILQAIQPFAVQPNPPTASGDLAPPAEDPGLAGSSSLSEYKALEMLFDREGVQLDEDDDPAAEAPRGAPSPFNQNLNPPGSEGNG